MSLINNFLISIFSKEVGKDEYGNKYYESKKQDYLGRPKRQVIYEGKAEASKIPPMWHAWLHYMINELPNNSNKYSWQQNYLPNLSGSKLALKASTNNPIKQKYTKWKPY